MKKKDEQKVVDSVAHHMSSTVRVTLKNHINFFSSTHAPDCVPQRRPLYHASRCGSAAVMHAMQTFSIYKKILYLSSLKLPNEKDTGDGKGFLMNQACFCTHLIIISIGTKVFESIKKIKPGCLLSSDTQKTFLL